MALRRPIVKAIALGSVFLAVAGGRAEARDLADFISGLYGGDRLITLRQTSGPPHDPSFVASAIGDLEAINKSLAELPATLPVGSSAASFTYELNAETGVPERVAAEGLGPLFVERARTVGRFKFDTAFLWTHIDFNEFQGRRLKDLNFTAPLKDVPGGDFVFENNVVLVDVDIEAREDIFSFFLTFGVTEWLDLNAVVPLVWVDLKVRAHGELAGKGGASPDPIHTFEGAPDPQDDGGSGDAFGFGDAILRAKWRFFDTFFGPKPPLSDHVELAVLGQVKLPTGDEANLLGTGGTNYRLVAIASKTLEGWFEPQLNLGYEWSGSGANHDAYLFAGGFAAKVTDYFTIFGDVIGRFERKRDGIGDDIVDLSAGFKLNPWRNLILSANLLYPLTTDQGLRADYIPSIAVEYIW